MTEYITEVVYDTFHGTFTRNICEEIVRCRDCKWLRVDMSDHEYRSGYWCDMGRFDPKPDGFCAWGERREV